MRRPVVLVTAFLAALTGVLPASASAAAPVAAGSAGVTAPSAAAAFAPPRPDRLIGGPTLPQVGAWGLAYNPVSDEFAVGDYLASQVRRYSRSGNYLGDFTNPGGTVGGVSSGLGVDARDGSMYLAVTGEGRTSQDIRKYDRFGNFLFEIDLPRGSTWVAVDKLTGDLWAPQAFQGNVLRRYRIDPVTHAAHLQVEVDNPGTGPGQFNWLTGVASDAAGNVYVADTGNNTVHSYTHNGVWRFDIGGRPLFKGDLRGVTVDDARGRIYVANSGGGTIEAFTMSGTHVGTIGSTGSGNGQFVDGPRQLATTPDGLLWAADYGQFRVMSFQPTGGYVSQFPSPSLARDPAGMSQARGIDIDPTTGDVLSIDAWGQRLLRYSADGRLLDSVGRRGSTTPHGMNYPKAVAVDTNGDVWVSNYEGAPHLVRYDAALDTALGRIVTPRFITDIEIAGNLLYAVERRPGGLHVYDKTTGAEVRYWRSTVGVPRGMALDPTTGNVWLTTERDNRVAVLSPANVVLATFALTGTGWGIDILGNEVYIANSVSGTIQVYDRLTFAPLGTFGSSGTGMGQLKQPSGLVFDSSGRLYVQEMANRRIQVFTTAAPLPAETVKPTLAVASPTPGAPQVIVTGTASDASGIATVEVQVKDNVSGRFYNHNHGTWTTTGYFTPSIVWGPITSVSFRNTVVNTLPGRSYTLRIRAKDRLGNSVIQTRTVTIP